MWGVQQAHPDHPTYPRWSATWAPKPMIKETPSGFWVVEFQYFEATWHKSKMVAAFNQIVRRAVYWFYSPSRLYEKCKRHNAMAARDVKAA